MTDEALVVDSITAGYGGGDVLHDVSFRVPAGQITCIVGPNGAGKSTLLAVISGILKPRSGQVLHLGQRLTGKSPREVLRAGVVQVPQNHSLFPDMTVAENIELGGYTLGSRALVASRRASVEGLFPDIGKWGKKKAGSLSGGQQRLVEFARCLMLDPAVIILDEPSMGLAPKILSGVFAAVQEMNAQGKTVLLVEQNARAGLRIAGHGVVLENGRVRLTGTGTEVLEHPEIGMLYLGGSSGTGQPAAAASGLAHSEPGRPGPAPQRTKLTDAGEDSRNKHRRNNHGRSHHGPAA
jgi:ABC-type branched-subunit amino acid transport system ATPase component